MRLRIAYCLHNTIKPSDQTGAQIQLFRTLDGLRRAGHRVDIFMRDGRQVFFTQDFEHREPCPLRWSNNRLFRVMESGLRRIQSELKLPYLSLFDNYRFYEGCLTAFPGYDLCHDRNGLLSVGAAMAAKQLNIPYVLFHDADILFELDYMGEPMVGIQRMMAARMARYTYETAAVIICVAEEAKQHLSQHWKVNPDKIEVLPNAVDVHLFGYSYDNDATKASLGLSDKLLVMFVGSFFQWHDLDTLIAAWPIVLAKVPSAHLVLVGDGMRKPEVERRVAEGGLATSVRFTGAVPHDRIPALLSAADVVVAPYPRFDVPFWGSPMKIFEYMAAGKPIVASRVGQVARILADGKTGRLVDPGRPDELGSAIVALLQDKTFATQMGAAARQQALDKHSWEQYISRLEAIYDRALSARFS